MLNEIQTHDYTTAEAEEFKKAYEKTTAAAARNLGNAISELFRAIIQTWFPFLNKQK